MVSQGLLHILDWAGYCKTWVKCYLFNLIRFWQCFELYSLFPANVSEWFRVNSRSEECLRLHCLVTVTVCSCMVSFGNKHTQSVIANNLSVTREGHGQGLWLESEGITNFSSDKTLCCGYMQVTWLSHDFSAWRRYILMKNVDMKQIAPTYKCCY